MSELLGRKKIYTDETEITSGNVIAVLRNAMITHQINREQISYLLEYERGKMPILDRIKAVRPEINIKVVDNMASEITDFHLGYEWGNPITYVQRARTGISEGNANLDDGKIAELNEMMNEECKAAKDQELARFVEVCGVGYRMIKAKPFVTGKSVFDVLTLNPLNTFVVYSNDIYKRPMMAVTYTVYDNGSRNYGVYTETAYFEIKDAQKIVEEKKEDFIPDTIVNGDGLGIQNALHTIPIIEYVNDFDRMGCFEKAIYQIDALNIVQSDRVNDIVQCVQSMLWIHNTEIPTDEEGKPIVYNNMLLQTKSVGDGTKPLVQYLSKEMNQEGIQTLASNLTSRIREITFTPGSQNNSGGSTGSAVTLSNLWQNAENNAMKKEQITKQAETKMLKVILEIFKNSTDVPDGLDSLKLSDIEIKANRNKTYDVATKMNAIASGVKLGFDPLAVLNAIPFFADNQQVYNDSKDRIDKLLFTSKEPKVEKAQADYSDQPDKLPFGDTQ